MSWSSRVDFPFCRVVFLLAVVVFGGISSLSAQLVSKIVKLDGNIGSELLKERVIRNTNLFFEQLTKGDSLNRSIISKSGYPEIAAFVGKHPFLPLKSELALILTGLESKKGYVIDGIPVRFQNQQKVPGMIPELSIYYDREGRLQEIKVLDQTLSMDVDSYMELENNRSAITAYVQDFLKEYKKAFNEKNLSYIEQLFSEKAIIIVGNLVKEKPETEMKGIVASSSRYAYFRLSKSEYINRLKTKIFPANKEIDLRFTDMTVLQHPVFSDMYRISVKQAYRSTTYNDLGYLTLIVGKVDGKPVIYVRIWQSEEDFLNIKTKITMDDFSING